jgi:hypothetical protein
MEEKKDQWLNYLAVTTVLIALGATLSTVKGAGFTSKSILKQTQASNEWAYYQAKSVKSYLYELQKEKIELDLQLLGPNAPKETVEQLQTLIQGYQKKIDKYDKEKEAIQAKARHLEAERDTMLKHSEPFSMAVIFFQLAILLSSLATLMKKPILWGVGAILAVAGGVFFANGFWLFF